MNAILGIAFVLLVVGAVVAFHLQDLLLSRLRALHPDIWEALGAPTRFFDDGGFATFSAVRQFSRSPEYQSRCGADLVRLARFTRIYVRVYMAISVLILGLFLFFTWIDL